MKIDYINRDICIIQEIQQLLEELNIHHGKVSPFFRKEFENNSFDQRVENLRRKYSNGLIRIDIAKHKEQAVGYIISTINEENVGEIESLFIHDRYRGAGIGENLMHSAIAWFDARNVVSKVVNVAYGNEAAFDFYSKHRFFPRVTRLVQKEPNTQ